MDIQHDMQQGKGAWTGTMDKWKCTMDEQHKRAVRT
jgi:hypothetical protein